MSVLPEHEAPRPAAGPAFSDAITYAFGDPDANLFGVARLGLAAEGGERQVSGLAVLFSGLQPVAARAAGGLAVPPGAEWDAIGAAGVRTTILEPLQRWDVRFSGEDGATGFALRFAALSPPAELPADHAAAQAGGMEGYEQLCRVTGIVHAEGRELAVDCLGQRGHTWGAPDWEQIALARTVNAWIGEDLGLSVTGIRPRKAKTHAEEALGGTLWAPLGEGDEVRAVLLPEVRLSTSSDGEGRQRRATIELYLDEEDPGHRAAGEVVCGTSLDLGRLRLDCSFFLWRMEGRSGVGRYDVLRRVGA